MQATQSLTIDTQDEDVLIAVRALGDMRGTGLVGHTPRSASSSYWETNTNGMSFIMSALFPSL